MDPTRDVTNYGPSRSAGRARRAQPAADPRPDVEDEIERVLADVRAERLRQVTDEGWTPEHDDQHQEGELARAGAIYAVLGGLPGPLRTDTVREVAESLARRRFPAFMLAVVVRAIWPFSWHWFRPRSPRRDLVRAAALMLAEIERQDRATRLALAAPEPSQLDLLRGE